MFDLLGTFLGLYTAYAAVVGSVFIRHRAWGRSVARDAEPRYFWCVIAIYAVLAAAMIGYF